MTNEVRGVVLSLRVPDPLSERLDAMVTKYPMLNRHAIARVALERGLDAIEADPRWFEKAGRGK